MYHIKPNEIKRFCRQCHMNPNVFRNYRLAYELLEMALMDEETIESLLNLAE